MTLPLTAADVVDLLRQSIAASGGTNRWARQHGINQATVSQVANGHMPPPIAIANALGLVELPRRWNRLHGAKS